MNNKKKKQDEQKEETKIPFLKKHAIPDERSEFDNQGVDYKIFYDYKLKPTRNWKVSGSVKKIGAALYDLTHAYTHKLKDFADLFLNWFCDDKGSFMNGLIDYCLPNYNKEMNIATYQGTFKKQFSNTNYYNCRMPLSHFPTAVIHAEF